MTPYTITERVNHSYRWWLLLSELMRCCQTDHWEQTSEIFEPNFFWHNMQLEMPSAKCWQIVSRTYYRVYRWDLMTQICVTKLGHHWFGQCLPRNTKGFVLNISYLPQLGYSHNNYHRPLSWGVSTLRTHRFQWYSPLRTKQNIAKQFNKSSKRRRRHRPWQV